MAQWRDGTMAKELSTTMAQWKTTQWQRNHWVFGHDTGYCSAEAPSQKTLPSKDCSERCKCDAVLQPVKEQPLRRKVNLRLKWPRCTCLPHHTSALIRREPNPAAGCCRPFRLQITLLFTVTPNATLSFRVRPKYCYNFAACRCYNLRHENKLSFCSH